MAERSGQTQVKVWVDAELYAKAGAGRGRGWLTTEVTNLLERLVAGSAEPTLIDFGTEPAVDDLSKMTVLGDSVTGFHERAEIPKHTFRRGKVLDSRWVKGVEEKLYACADECGLERWV